VVSVAAREGVHTAGTDETAAQVEAGLQALRWSRDAHQKVLDLFDAEAKKAREEGTTALESTHVARHTMGAIQCNLNSAVRLLEAALAAREADS
jgi:flagellar motor component MotA